MSTPLGSPTTAPPPAPVAPPPPAPVRTSTPEPRPIGRLRRLWRLRWAYFFIAPAVGLLFIVHMYPIAKVVLLSFQRYDVAEGTSSYHGVGNYERLFADPLFFQALLNTFIYTLLVVPAAMVLALVLAYLVQPLQARMQTFFKAAFYLPGVVSPVVLALVWAWLYNADFGLLNYLLSLVGVDPVMWLGDRRIALTAIAIPTVASGLGVPLLLFLAALGNIPDSYYEAARLDGAGRLREFIHISLPLLKPTILYLLIVMTIGSFQVFDTIYLLTNGGPSYATTTLVFLVYESAFRFYDFGMASAQAVVLFVLVVLMAVGQFKWLASDVEY